MAAADGRPGVSFVTWRAVGLGMVCGEGLPRSRRPNAVPYRRGAFVARRPQGGRAQGFNLQVISSSRGGRAAIACWRFVDARDRGGEACFEVIGGYRLAHVEGEAGALPGCELGEQLSNFPGREP